MQYGRRSGPWGWARALLVVGGLFILLLFVVDKLVLAPPLATVKAGTAAALLQRLQHHDVRRVTVRTYDVTVETKDGTTFRARVPADRDLGPALRDSGAELVVLAGHTAPETSSSPLAAVFQFAPFGIMALLLLFVLRRQAPRSTR